MVIASWAETLVAATSQVFGGLTVTVSVVAVALAVLHLVGTDTMTFLAYEDTLAAGSTVPRSAPTSCCVSMPPR